MAGDYNGLTRNLWPGTWSASESHPIVLDSELRGSLRSITGSSGSRLTDITGQRLQEGMLVFVKTGYTEGAVTRKSGSYYQYNLLVGEVRDVNTGASPNSEANWSEFVGGKGEGSGPLGFIVNPTISYQRDLVTYYDTDGPKSIRKYVTYYDSSDTSRLNPKFALQLASFSPSFAISNYSPAATLNWDEPFVSFTVRVTNPEDYTSQYISSVGNIINTSNSTLGEFVGPFNSDPQTPPAGGGIIWTKTFYTTNTSTAGLIRSKTSNFTGGQASATIQFNSITNSGPEINYSDTLPITVNWRNASNNLEITDNVGNIFLNPYTATSYTTSHSGTSNPPIHTVTATGGTILNGIFSFNNPVTPFTYTNEITLQLSSEFSRPLGISSIGAYSTTINLAAKEINPIFLFPSFYLFTTSIAILPIKDDIVTGNNFRLGVVTELGDKQSTIGTSATAVSIGVPPYTSAGFWFGVLNTSDINLTKFGTGSSPINASQTNNESNVVKFDIDLYNELDGIVTYTIYGFTVNPLSGGGPTYLFASTS